MNKVDMSYRGLFATIYLAVGCNILGSYSSPIHGPMAKKEIAIIGAGLAGLSCAFDLEEILTEHDLFDLCNITVYEARGRTGGRLLTVKINDHIAELGGYNIRDGLQAHNLRSLINELGLTVTSYYKTRDNQWKCTKYFDGEKFVFTKGRLKKCNLDINTLHDTLVKLADASRTIHDVLIKLFPDDPILYTVFAAKMSDYEGAPVDKLSAHCIDTLEYQLSGALKSAQGHEDEKMVPIEYVEGGNALITERLAERLQSKIYLNMPLQSIEREADGTGYLLSFSTGELHRADIIIFTIPCPTYANIVFGKETVPAQLLDAISSVEYGTNAKIIIPVLTAKKGAGSSYTNGRATLSIDDQNHLTVYYISHNGAFSPETIESHLKRDWSFIESSYNLTPHLPDPVCAQDKQFVSYTGPVGHSWPNDPYVKGSYSYLAAGQEESFIKTQEYAGEYVKELFTPINNQIFFAGEHTTILENVGGTMEAAAESGRRMARIVGKTIIDSYAPEHEG